MRYPDLRPAIAAYKDGRNVMETLRALLGVVGNNDDIVEIAYDLQAGSYSSYTEANQDYWRAYSAEIAAILREVAKPGDRILDAGSGEMTTLSGVAAAGLPADIALFACDISYSRIKVGLDFTRRHMPAAALAGLQAFAGNLFRLPFQNAALDIVCTAHALEPNGGKEREAVAELLRISRGYVVLFEPSYELNTDEGRERMDRLGYIRDLPGAIAAAGGVLEAVRPLRTVSNPLNPPHAYICRRAVPVAEARPAEPWACPNSLLPMTRRADCFFSAASRLAYPVIDGVPVLRAEQAILASALD